MRNNILSSLQGGLIVSCQAYEGDPLFGSSTMTKLALAAKLGGAKGIRANSPDDISAIKAEVNLPIIGLWKKYYEGSEVYITPTINEVNAVAKAGADIIAMDGTLRQRPNNETLEDICKAIRIQFPDCLLMADVSTLEEGIHAEKLGFDVVSTTLSGYTSYSPQQKEPDFLLIQQLKNKLKIPVFAEGKIQTVYEARKSIDNGAFAVVIGSAITRPELITERFVKALEQPV